MELSSLNYGCNVCMGKEAGSTKDRPNRHFDLRPMKQAMSSRIASEALVKANIDLGSQLKNRFQ